MLRLEKITYLSLLVKFNLSIRSLELRCFSIFSLYKYKIHLLYHIHFLLYTFLVIYLAHYKEHMI